jgi:hypothetical protein
LSDFELKSIELYIFTPLTKIVFWNTVNRVNGTTNLLVYYNNRILCVCVCLTLYRLGPWVWYRLETSVIRTSMTWTRDFEKKFSRKVTSGQITEEKLYATNVFLWEKYRAFCFNVWKAIIYFHFEQLGQVITRTYGVITRLCYEKF